MWGGIGLQSGRLKRLGDEVLRKLKAIEEAPVRQVVLPTARETFDVVSDDEDDVNAGSLAVGLRISLQETADFETGFKDAGATLKSKIADPKGQRRKDVSTTRDLCFVGKGGQSDELTDLKEGMQKENAEFHAARAAEKAACAKRLLEVSVLRVGKVS